MVKPMKNRIESLGENFNIEIFVDFLKAINETTDDYMYLVDFKSKRAWFGGDVHLRFPLQDKGLDYCDSDDILYITHPKDRPLLQADREKLFSGQKDFHNLDYRWIDKDGNSVWINCRGIVLKDANGNPFGMFGRVSEIVLKHMVDKKTNLFNKSKMIERMEEVLTSGQQGHFVLVGIDDIKDINSRYGRKQGDVVIGKVAEVLSASVENPYNLFRLDGDYFGICSYMTDKDEIDKRFRDMQAQLSDVCTFSVGIVSFDDVNVKDPIVVYQFAENIMNEVKKNGKNGIAFFKNEVDENKHMGLADELRRSVNNGCEGFYIVYQPQVDINDDFVYGVEALLRYVSPNGKMIFPDEFIPILEKTGLIRPVGLWVLENAIIDCREWRKNNPHFHISVNLSYEQLKDAAIADKVLELLDKYDFDGEALYFEVTESIQLQNFTYYNKIFAKWKSAGIKIAVDDFGTGYSSLAYLKNLDIDEIKIDRCFVSDIQDNSYNYRLIKNIIELAKGSDISVCCEGVETEDELNILKELDAGIVQGYFYSKPVKKDIFQEFLENFSA